MKSITSFDFTIRLIAQLNDEWTLRLHQNVDIHYQCWRHTYTAHHNDECMHRLHQKTETFFTSMDTSSSHWWHIWMMMSIWPKKRHCKLCWKLTLDSEQINTWTFPWLTTVPPQINPIAKLSASLPNWPHQIRCFCGERKCGGSERTGVLPVYPSSQPRQNIFPSIRNANDTKSILVRAMCCAFCLPVAVAGLFCLN